MPDPQEIFSEFVSSHRRDGATDPREFLARTEGVDREELRLLIEAYLQRAPRQEWDAEAYSGSIAERAIAAASPEFDGPAVEDAQGWPELLPALRNGARLRRAAVVERLAAALGFPDSEERVAAYYHRMEQGRLASGGVSTRVLEALGEIIGAPASLLRRAGEAGEAGEMAGGEVFARLGMPSGEGSSEVVSLEHAEERIGDGEADELDRLFIGGDAGAGGDVTAGGD